jgi:hypothetical protein
MRTSRSMSCTLLSVMRAWPRIVLTSLDRRSDRVEAIGQGGALAGAAKVHCGHDFIVGPQAPWRVGWPGVLAVGAVCRGHLAGGDPVERLAAMALPAAGWHAPAGAGASTSAAGAVRGARLGFAPVLSLTVWLVIGLHADRKPLRAAARGAQLAGAGRCAGGGAGCLLSRASQAHLFSPGRPALRAGRRRLWPVRRGRAACACWMPPSGAAPQVGPPGGPGHAAAAARAPDLPLRRGGLRGAVGHAGAGRLDHTVHWRWDHKTVLSLLGWAVFAALLTGRRLRGWRGRRATRWLYAGARCCCWPMWVRASCSKCCWTALIRGVTTHDT